MAARTVTLNIEVRDGSVREAEASLNRLKNAANNVGGGRVDGSVAAAAKRAGVSYDEMAARIKRASGGVTEGERAVRDMTAAVSETAPATNGAATAFAGLGRSAGPAAAAVAAVVVVVVAAGKAVYELGQYIFKLSSDFADYANEVGDAARETGLAAQTISALKREAAAAGQSFGTIESAVNAFRTTIGQAAAGSEKARASLKAIGIDASTAVSDIDRSFKSAVRSVAEMPPGIEQARAAFNLFGADGAKLLPFLRDFDGNIEDLIADSHRLGVVVSGENVVAAREFRRAYKDVQDQVTGLKNTFGSEFLPVVTEALKSFGGWIQQNKATITDWASWAAEKLDWLIQKFYALRQAGADFDQWVRDRVPGGTYLAGPAPSPYQGTATLPVDPRVQNAVPTRLPGLNYGFDPKALDAARATQEKLRQEIIATAKRDFEALIQNWSLYGAGLQEQFTEVFKMIKSELAGDGDIAQFTTRTKSAIDTYIASITQADEELKRLEDEQARRNGITVNERELLTRRQMERNAGFAKTYVAIQQEAEKIVEDLQKRNSANYLEMKEAQMRRLIELQEAESSTLLAVEEANYEARKQSLIEYTVAVNTAELGLLIFRKQQLTAHLAAVKGNAEKETDILHSIALLDQTIAQQKITNENRVAEVKRQIQEQENERLKAYNDYKQALEDELGAVSRLNRPLSVYEQTVRDISRNYKEFTAEEQKHLLSLAAQIDLVDELNRRHAEMKAFFEEPLSYALDGDFGGLVDSFTRRIKDTFVDSISNFLASTILGFDPNRTDNPVAKPIVGKLDQTNQILNRIAGAVGAPTSLIPGMGSLNLGTIFGGSAGGGIYNFGGSGSWGPAGSGQGGLDGIDIGSGGFDPITGTYSGGSTAGGNLFDQFKQIFSSGEGGLFAPRRGSKLAGYAGGAGDIAAMIGGMIGGHAGGIISSIGTGVSIGSMFGPWGALIGGGIGLIAGLFGGDPKRKRDKNEKLPALHAGFTEALNQLREILTGVRTLSIDPDDAISRASDVRAEIAGGFGIEFESKKYRRQAQQLIAAKLGEADGIIEEIKQASEIARGAADRSQRILPEFAGGHYFADYFRPNGLVPGTFDGADNILAMISRGEMVLNPLQQRRVRALAGHDVFAHAGIPNYPKASTSPKLAGGGIAGAGLIPSNVAAPVIAPNFTIVMSGVTFTDQTKAWVESDDGKRTLVKLLVDREKGKV